MDSSTLRDDSRDMQRLSNMMGGGMSSQMIGHGGMGRNMMGHDNMGRNMMGHNIYNIMSNRGMISDVSNQMGQQMDSNMMDRDMAMSVMGRNMMGQDSTSQMMGRNMMHQQD